MSTTQLPSFAPPPQGPPPQGPPPGGPSSASSPEGPGLFNGATTHGVMGRPRIRHPWEIPMVVVAVLFTLLCWALWITLIVLLSVGAFRQDVRFQEMILGLPLAIQLLVIVPLAAPLIWFGRAMLYAQMRSRAVRMSPTQFPEGYRMVAETAQAFGLRKMPDAYVLSGSGVINAFASGHGFRRFVIVHSDLFEVGDAVRDPEALRFVVAHEVGHIAAGHVSFFRLLFTSLLYQVPLLGPTLSRSQEYTADNYGYALCPDGAVGAVALLSGGKYLNGEVNVHELADRAATDPSLFVHLVNLQSTHPIITWRAAALRDRCKPGAMIIRPRGNLFVSPLPPGHVWSSRYPSPQDALRMLDEADRVRPAGTAGQFGRYPGAHPDGRPPARHVQLLTTLISGHSGYTVPPGPYREDARRMG
ncbi:M48 family metallopeptidase [Brachybacterium sp. EF45031]|uniref:M48 family metallopeptidase n=1 Tax=Brachybacterium sillae TaxID=2810536 RepID=UPI00217D0BB4|nr:M48 family metallopeptidase [Brachybacterium sillae]MCS6711609.1 M48 family metallopeptidase [Brachybacterium sillae]